MKKIILFLLINLFIFSYANADVVFPSEDFTNEKEAPANVEEDSNSNESKNDIMNIGTISLGIIFIIFGVILIAYLAKNRNKLQKDVV